MVERVRYVSVPIVFSDGENETSIGNIAIKSSTAFKTVQTILSKKIGISPHQIKVYVIDRKRRRIPISRKIDLFAIAGEGGCYFLVVLRRWRRERKRKNHYSFQENCYGSFEEDREYSSPVDSPPSPIVRYPQYYVPENFILLRRNPELINQQYKGITFSPYYTPVAASVLQSYLMMPPVAAKSYSSSEEEKHGAAEKTSDGGFSCIEVVVCDECQAAETKETAAEFHCCVNDAVIEWFRSSAGPIERPVFRVPMK